ncbi:MAG TPA: GH3 auxin-responsive promoter family protein, partial [Methylomirabilota bacterium]|nr:GH3 auxin-responsive promoter family protein [Methylomirabilota bacterium]
MRGGDLTRQHARAAAANAARGRGRAGGGVLTGTLQRLRFRALNAAWLAGQRVGHRALRAALHLPARAQAARLHATLARNAGCDYGRRHGFAKIRTFREYQDAVPIVGWDDVAPWVEAMKAGRANVLTSERVLVFETTGGSTGGAKYVPYTR